MLQAHAGLETLPDLSAQTTSLLYMETLPDLPAETTSRIFTPRLTRLSHAYAGLEDFHTTTDTSQSARPYLQI